MDEMVMRLFSSNFDIKKYVYIGKTKMDYVAYRYDVIGRTMAITKKEIDTYTNNENIYILKKKLKKETFKKEMEKLFDDIVSTLSLSDDHYETLLNLVIFSELDKDLSRMIERYQKTKLLALGFKGAINMRVIAIDNKTKEIRGNKTNKELMEKLRRGMT